MVTRRWMVRSLGVAICLTVVGAFVATWQLAPPANGDEPRPPTTGRAAHGLAEQRISLRDAGEAAAENAAAFDAGGRHAVTRATSSAAAAAAARAATNHPPMSARRAAARTTSALAAAATAAATDAAIAVEDAATEPADGTEAPKLRVRRPATERPTPTPTPASGRWDTPTAIPTASPAAAGGAGARGAAWDLAGGAEAAAWVQPDSPAPYRLSVRLMVQCCPRRQPWTSLRSAYELIPAPLRPELDVVVYYHSKACSTDRERILPADDRWLSSPAEAVCLPTLTQDPSARRVAVLGLEPPSAGEDGGPAAFLVLLEDVDEVSPLLFLWADYTIRSYLLPRRDEAEAGAEDNAVRIMGASLYGPRYNEVADRPFDGPAGAPYLLQFPPAWGAIYAASDWGRFRTWCTRPQNALAPSATGLYVSGAFTNRWPVQTSWRKWLVRYLAETGTVLLYPPRGWSFVMPTGKATPAGHPANANEPANRGIFYTPLLTRRATAVRRLGTNEAHRGREWLADLPFPPVPPVRLAALDLYHRPAPNAAAEALRLDARASEGCTLVMAVYSRLGTLHERLRHLDDAPIRLRLILLIWNNMDVEPTPIPPGLYRTPIVVKRQARNSMNNRLFPQPEIHTDCVMLMDDDFDMPYDILDQVQRTWHGHMFDRLVGVVGRNFHWTADDGYSYVASSSRAPSISLPSGMVFHRKYMAAYAALPAPLLQVVDDVINCEDLLFNVMMANLTGHGPLTISATILPVRDLSKDGMFSRPTHFATRSWCLNEFARGFPDGRLPLRCTKAAPRKFVNDRAVYVPFALADVVSASCNNTDT